MDRNAYFDQKVFIARSGEALNKVDGVQGFDANWSVPSTPVAINGYGFMEDAIEGTLEGSVTIDKIVTSQQNIFSPLFDATLSGTLAYGSSGLFDRNFIFSNAYISSYTSACTVNEVATENVSINCYGGIMGSGNTGLCAFEGDTVFVAQAGNISLSISNPNDAADRIDLTDAIQSYNIEATINRRVIEAGIGSNFIQPMSNFLIEYPIPLKTSVDLLVTQYESPLLMDLVCGPEEKNISIILRDCSRAIDIRSFNIGESKLSSYSSSSAIGDNLSVSLEFIKNITGIADLTTIIQ